MSRKNRQKRKLKKEVRAAQAANALTVTQAAPGKGKSVAAVALAAPMLIPVVAEAVTQVVKAFRGKAAVSKAAGGEVVPVQASPGNYAIDGQRLGLREGGATKRGKIMIFSEEIGSVTLPISWGTTLAAGSISYTTLSPINGYVHPVNYTEAQFYQNFRVRRVVLRFVPTAGDQQSGSIVLGYIDTPVGSAAVDAVSAEARAASNPHTFAIPANMPFETEIKGVSSWSKEYICAATPNQDLNDITPGCIFCYGVNTSAATIGRLLICAEYELMDRRPMWGGVGLAVNLWNMAGAATSEKDRAVVRAKLIDYLKFVSGQVLEKIQPLPPPREPEQLTEAEFNKQFRQLPFLDAPTKTRL